MTELERIAVALERIAAALEAKTNKETKPVVMVTTDDDLLNPQETADLLQTNVGVLANFRYKGGGPAYTKVGRMVRYRLGDVQSYRRSSPDERRRPGKLSVQGRRTGLHQGWAYGPIPPR